MISPTVHARRSLCYLFCDQPDSALRDAMQAQIVYGDWPTAFYMQSVALAKLDMHQDSLDMLNEAAGLEEKRQKRDRREYKSCYINDKLNAKLVDNSFFSMRPMFTLALKIHAGMHPKQK
ncbi:probable serine/threonine-protein kinase [Tanacetum coccineum]